MVSALGCSTPEDGSCSNTSGGCFASFAGACCARATDVNRSSGAFGHSKDFRSAAVHQAAAKKGTCSFSLKMNFVMLTKYSSYNTVMMCMHIKNNQNSFFYCVFFVDCWYCWCLTYFIRDSSVDCFIFRKAVFDTLQSLIIVFVFFELYFILQ